MMAGVCRQVLADVHRAGRAAIHHHTRYRQVSTAAHPGELIGHKIPERKNTYDHRDVILYALGVGYKVGDHDYLKFLYENDPSFRVLPTFGTLFTGDWLHQLFDGSFPMKVDLSQVFHGEQYIEFKKPLQTNDTLLNVTSFPDAMDKGKSSVLVIEVDSYDSEGSHVVHQQSLVFTRQYSNWGGNRKSDRAVASVPAPDRPPDAVVTETTSPSQAALYRLSGDYNPFHIDPKFAAKGGFEKPILHGLCSYGISSKHVLQQFCDSDTTKFKASKLRFSSPVLPGQSLQTEMWKEGSRIHFQTKVAETGKICISGAHIDLHE